MCQIKLCLFTDRIDRKNDFLFFSIGLTNFLLRFFAATMHTKKLSTHSLNEHGTHAALLTPQPSAQKTIHICHMHSATIKFLKTPNIPYTPYQPSTAHSCCTQDKTIPAILSSNYIASTHNITPSPCTSTCTTHPAVLSPLAITTLLCTQLTNIVGKMAQVVGMV